MYLNVIGYKSDPWFWVQSMNFLFWIRYPDIKLPQRFFTVYQSFFQSKPEHLLKFWYRTHLWVCRYSHLKYLDQQAPNKPRPISSGFQYGWCTEVKAEHFQHRPATKINYLIAAACFHSVATGNSW